MNHCIFTGYLLDEPEVSTEDGCCVFRLVMYEVVKNRRGEKKSYPTYIKCQIWDTGAEAFTKLGSKNDKVTIHASAKNPYNGLDPDSVVFRVNEFDFAHLNKEN
jgi:single-stranded DNA-binding protein